MHLVTSSTTERIVRGCLKSIQIKFHYISEYVLGYDSKVLQGQVCVFSSLVVFLVESIW